MAEWWSSNSAVLCMNGEVDGMEMLIDGTSSTGKKLLGLPFFTPELALARGELLDGSPADMGIVDDDGVNVDWPNSVASLIPAFLTGKVIADRLTLMIGRIGAGPTSECACTNGGGMVLRLAEADEASDDALFLSDDLSRCIDIFRRNPHFPVFDDELAVRRLDGPGEGVSS